VGADGAVAIDANEGLDVYQARSFARSIADYNISFFEEPLDDNDILRLADFRREAPMPIAAGHYETSLARWRDMAVNNSVDILLMNVCSGGGFTAGVKVAALAEAFGMPLNHGGGYANFNMHLHAGVAHGGLCEWHLETVALIRALYKGMPELIGDRLVLPTTPGLGFELNRDALKEFAVKPA
jgi:L-alanine-DL-glutamate epimerase-like enolase superfamily enzyme